MIKTILALILTLCGAQAFADLEVRGQFGLVSNQAGSLNDTITKSLSPNPSITGITSIGGDVLLTFPLVPFVVGVRYESFSGKASGQGTLSSTSVNANTKVSGSRVLALAGYRPLDTPIGYIGVLAHYSLSQSINYSESTTPTAGGSATDYSFSGTTPPSYGAGIEAGLTLSRLVLGLEAGYTSFKMNDISENSKTLVPASSSPTLDLSGIYVRASIGVSFF